MGSESYPELIRYNGSISSASSGWKYVEEKAGEIVYIPFEGYYESKGGRIQSPEIKLDRPAGENAFYRLKFTAMSKDQCYWWVDFFDTDHKWLPDCNSAVYPGAEREYDQVFIVPPQAASIQLAFLSKEGVEVKDVSVGRIAPCDAAKWADELYSKLQPVSFRAASSSRGLVPKTARALEGGTPLHIVMLGDSIVNDTYTSIFEALVMRDFPKAKLKFMISVRGSTGCWFYHEAANFNDYVAVYKPDVVMIGGISNIQKLPLKEAEDYIAETVERCKALGAEVILMTPPFSYEWRKSENDSDWHKEDLFYLNTKPHYGAAKRTGCCIWDMTVPVNDYIGASGKPLGYFSRDTVHNNDMGKQVIARVLSEYFRGLGRK